MFCTSAYLLILSLGKTWNEKRIGNVGRRQDRGRRVLEVAELRYIHLGTGSEHAEHWSHKGMACKKRQEMSKGKKSSWCRISTCKGIFTISCLKFS
jgi:hypothetical protein